MIGDVMSNDPYAEGEAAYLADPWNYVSQVTYAQYQQQARLGTSTTDHLQAWFLRNQDVILIGLSGGLLYMMLTGRSRVTESRRR